MKVLSESRLVHFLSLPRDQECWKVHTCDKQRKVRGIRKVGKVTRSITKSPAKNTQSLNQSRGTIVCSGVGYYGVLFSVGISVDQLLIVDLHAKRLWTLFIPVSLFSACVLCLSPSPTILYLYYLHQQSLFLESSYDFFKCLPGIYRSHQLDLSVV